MAVSGSCNFEQRLVDTKQVLILSKCVNVETNYIVFMFMYIVLLSLFNDLKLLEDVNQK